MAGESAREVARRARERAERLQRRAEMFERGADGEAVTAAALAGLPTGWSTIHDVRWPNRRLANIDHIVIGPAGIFVIDSKNWSGKLTVTGGVLRQNGRSREKYVASSADAALAIAELVTPYANHVVPVLCFVGQTNVEGWCRDVMICSTDSLTRMLLTRAAVLSPDHSTDAWFRLDAQLHSAMTAPAPLPPRSQGTRRPVHLPSSVRRSPSRGREPAGHRNKSILKLFASLAVLATFVTVGPTVASSIGEGISDAVTHKLAPKSACPAVTSPSPSHRARASGQRSKNADSTLQRKRERRARVNKRAKANASASPVAVQPSPTAASAPGC